MGGTIRGCGRIIIWKALGYIIGMMEEYMRVNTKKTKSMATASTCGKMVVNTRAPGGEESNMVSVSILLWMRRSMGYGKMERELNGLVMNR